MSNLLWKSLLASPAIVGTVFGIASNAQATDALIGTSATTETSGMEIAQSLDDAEIINQLDTYSEEGKADSVGQVTSVSQLSDVSPTDWAFEALRSLVERYGCIVGYPDRTYRGNRALSRYEFAAGLNACMQQMERLIAASEAVLREDIEKLQRLMKEFEAELAALGARVDNLEGRVAFLEDHQFSTTTKLAGEVIIATTGNFGSNNQNQQILGDRVRLELNTSFTGEDRLVTRLAAGNFGRFKNNYSVDAEVGGFQFNDIPLNDLESATNVQTFNLYPGSDNDVQIDWLAYYSPISLGKFNLNTYVAGWGGIHSDYAPTLNPYFEDYDGGNGALSTFASENPIYRIGGGGGAAASFEFGLLEGLLGPSTVTVGYLAGGANNPEEGQGLFNGDYALLSQLNFNIGDNVNFGFTYVHGYHQENSPIFGLGAIDPDGVGAAGVVGTGLANLSNSGLNQAFDAGGTGLGFDLKSKVTNSYGAELAWRITDRVNFSAFFTYTDVILTGRGSDQIWTYGGGFAFPDLGKEGNVLGIFAGVQPYLGDGKVPVGLFDGNGNRLGREDVTFSNNNPIHIEAFYKYQVTDNISLTPGVIWLSNPEQTDDSNDQVIGTLRATFTF